MAVVLRYGASSQYHSQLKRVLHNRPVILHVTRQSGHNDKVPFFSSVQRQYKQMNAIDA
jgi:hypothetical protein